VAGLAQRLARLSDNARGALWMLLAAGSFTFIDALARQVGQRIDPLQISFFRCAFGGLAILPFVLLAGRAAFRPTQLGGHVARALFSYIALSLIFYAVSRMPLAEAVTLTFTRALFMVLLAAVFLGERIRWRRSCATIVGFAGVLIMAPPLTLEFDPGLAAAIGAAFFTALVGVTLKGLSLRDRPVTIILCFGIISSLLALPAAIYVWRDPTPIELVGLALIGAGGSLAQYCSIRGYRIAEATAIEPFDYSRFIYALAFGLILFGELPGPATWAGAALIVVSTLYIARRDGQIRHGEAPAS
jgi:drug/metabolite transporter (DMT)-like permease